MRNLLYRVVTSLVLLPPVIAAFYLGGFYLIALLALCAMVCCFEVANIIHPQDKLALALAFGFGLALFLVIIFGKSLAISLALLLPVMFLFNAIILFTPSLDATRVEKLCAVLYWAAYASFGVACIFKLKDSFGTAFVVLACLCTWSNDSFAYFFGRMFGKHPLYKSVSSKKTWEGFLAGAVLSVLLVFFIKYCANFTGFDCLEGLNFTDLLWVSLPSAMLAPIGDLIESRFKRLYDKKDASQILPGHGGLLDRIDGLLVVIPWTAVYAFLIRPLW